MLCQYQRSTLAKRTSDPIDINGIEQEQISFWSPRDEMIRACRALRYMEQEPEVPARIKQAPIVTPIAATVVDRVSGMLTADPPKIKVPASSEHSKDEERASILERWLIAAFTRLSRQSHSNILAKFVQSLVQDGHGAMRLNYAPQLLAGRPKQEDGESDSDYNKRVENWKKGRPLPIAWVWLDPLTVYPRWDELGLCEVLEVAERPVLSLHEHRRRYNRANDYPELWEMDRAKAGNSTVKFQQLWRRDRLVYAVDGHVIHDQRLRGYSQPPYVYAFGLEGATTDPKYMGLSLLYTLLNIKPRLDELLTQKATNNRLTNWATYTLRITATSGQMPVDPSTGSPMRKVAIEPGGIIPLWPDEELKPLDLPRSNADLNELVNILMGQAQQATLPPAMYGNAASGDSGYAINQLISAARTLVKPIIDAAESAMEQAACLLLDIVENQAKEKLYVYHATKSEKGWVGLDPETINGYRNVEVKLLPLMPSDEYAKASMLTNLVQAGLVSKKYAREQLGIEQPDEEQRQIDYEAVRASPAVQQFFEAQAAREIGIQLQAGGMSPEQMQQQLSGASPALQQVLLQGAQGMGPAQGAPGQSMPGGADPAEVQALLQTFQQAEAQGIEATQAIAEVLQAGANPEAVIAALVQMGVPEEAARQLVARLAGGAMPPQGAGPEGERVPQVGGSGPIQAAPGVQAVPANPRPQAMAGARQVGHVGPVTRPSGVGTGRAPGVKRQ